MQFLETEEANSYVKEHGANIIKARRRYARIIEDASSLVESVDLLNVDENTNFNLAVTAGFSIIEYRDEVAWSVARALSTWWQYKPRYLWFNEPKATIRPQMTLTVDDTTYVAPFDLMKQTANLNVTFADWLNQARQ